MIGQHFGQKLDANQVKDLAGTLGLGAAAQVMESVVRKVLGGIAGGILGGLVGGVTGLAAGAAVSFSSTYALGHVAKARGIAKIAEVSGLGRESLYKALKPGSKLRYETMHKIIHALGFRLALSAA